MDFASVAGLTIPAGSVNKISIGGVVVWSKKSDGKYKILKNGVQVASVTMSQFVKAIQSGAAQEDWGIGAQIVVPYHDPWDENDYELPFNFGTFTAYGEGKLGLQAHYAIPSTPVSYSIDVSGSNYCYWENNSLARIWLNGKGKNVAKYNEYGGKAGFLDCIPEDFGDEMNSIKYGQSSVSAVKCKVFILGVVGSCASLEAVALNNNTRTFTPQAIYGDDSVWEYWSNKIGTPQKFDEINLARDVFTIIGEKTFRLILPNIVKVTGDMRITEHFNFTQNGYCNLSIETATTQYLPACVIG